MIYVYYNIDSGTIVYRDGEMAIIRDGMRSHPLVSVYLDDLKLHLDQVSPTWENVHAVKVPWKRDPESGNVPPPPLFNMQWYQGFSDSARYFYRMLLDVLDNSHTRPVKCINGPAKDDMVMIQRSHTRMMIGNTLYELKGDTLRVCPRSTPLLREEFYES